MKSAALMVVVMALGVCAPALAQTPVTPGTVYVSVNGMFQVSSNDFDDTSTFRENAENGTLTTEYAVGSGFAFDLAGGFAFMQNLAAGVGVTRYSHATPTAISASIPHPFFFNQPRTVEGEFEGDRSEVAVHIQVRAFLPLNPKMEVAVFGGPSFFTVKQTVVDDFSYTDSYPYDTATFVNAITSEQSEKAVGFHVGGEFTYFFSPNVGVGGTAQFSGASVEMTLPSGTADVDAGGFQVGGGVRLRF